MLLATMCQMVKVDLVSSASSDHGSSASEPPRKKPEGLSKILAKRIGTTSRIGLTTEKKIKQELDQYLSHPQLEMEDSPLDWWKVEHSRYPRLAKLARKYLCICATSVPSECVLLGRLSQTREAP